MCSSEGGNFSFVSFYFDFFICIFQKNVVPLRPKRTRVATDKLAGKEAVAWDLREQIKVQRDKVPSTKTIKVQRNDVRCTKNKLKYKGTKYQVPRTN